MFSDKKKFNLIFTSVITHSTYLGARDRDRSPRPPSLAFLKSLTAYEIFNFENKNMVELYFKPYSMIRVCSV
jgi:hypothetical protein